MSIASPAQGELEPPIDVGGGIGVLEKSDTLDGRMDQASGKLGVGNLADGTRVGISGILSKVSEVLPPEKLTGAKDQALEFQERLRLFGEEAKRVREGFGYKYEWSDYMKRLSVSNPVFIGVFERILSENAELRESYEGIIRGFSGNREKLKERIMKEYGGDLVHDGMKEREYGAIKTERMLDFRGKNAKEVKDMVIKYAKNGGKWLELQDNGLDGVFTGKLEQFKDMVVEFARFGGNGLGLYENGLGNIFAGEPKLFKEMVVEFAKKGGKWLNLGGNGLNEIFSGEPELFKDMVVEYARFGGYWLGLYENGLDKIFAGNPKLFTEMVLRYVGYAGKELDLRDNGLDELFVGEPELFKDMVVGYVRTGGKELNLGVNSLGKIFAGEPELFKDMVVEYAKFRGKSMNLHWSPSLSHILNSTIETRKFLVFFTKKITVREVIKEAYDAYGISSGF